MRTFFPNPDLADELASEDPAKEALLAAAEESAVEANRLRRRIMPTKGRGSRDAIVAQENEGRVEVANTDHGAHLDEWGSKNNPPYAPLRRGVEAAGYRLEESSK